MDIQPNKPTVRSEWNAHIGQRTRAGTGAPGSRATIPLPPPDNVKAESGAGQVTLRWQPVDGAVGYLIHRSEAPGGPYVVVNHGGGDVLAVPGPCYTDTTGQPGTLYWYAISSLVDATSPPGALSMPLEARSHDGPAEAVKLLVRAQAQDGQFHRAWWMLGSEHLSQLFYTHGPGGSYIGEEFTTALHMARTELGATHIRAHAILDDELGVYQETNGQISYNFTAIDRIYDRLLDLGLRPIVELSFMPRGLATDGERTTFTYRGIISPPRNWNRWGELVFGFASHLVGRYGIDEVRQWGFEVWNEANLQVFWTGTQADYFRLYEIAARAIKAVDNRLPVGGPATAAAEWIGDFLAFVQQIHAPLDFISTHTYGNLPLDVGQLLHLYGLHNVKVWWTEWGVTPTHFAPVNDSVFAAPFVLHGMKSVQRRADALAYWVISDHFEELGRAPRLFHGGFGLLTIGNLRKPRYWALTLLQDIGTHLVQLDLLGDGAGSMVDALATRAQDGTINILIWNGTLDQSKMTGSTLLDRHIHIRIEQLEDRTYHTSLARIDSTHSNIAAHWTAQDDWPSSIIQWAALHAVDRLDEQPLPDLHPINGVAHLALDLPMPGVARLRLTS